MKTHAEVMSGRRRFLIALGTWLSGLPLEALAQSQRPYRIGYLANSLNPASPTPTYAAFVARLRELDLVEGKNIELRIKSSDDKPSEFARLASELVHEKVDVIVCGSLAATRAAKAATTTIPIVFGSAENPVERGLVASLRRPGGNVTGFATIVQQLGPKRLELLKEALPRARRIGRLYHASQNADAQHAVIKQDDAAARSLGLVLEHIAVSQKEQLEKIFEDAGRNGLDAFNVKADGWLVRQRRFIADLALHHRVPVMGADDRFAEAGALLSYGENFPALYRRAADLVQKILKTGAKPAELPVEEATPELVVNLRTAKQLGISLPQSILVLASRTIS